MNKMTKRTFASRLEARRWGAFLLWIGVCFIMEISWGVGLLGVAVITLGAQAVRAIAKLAVEGFWVVMGCLLAGSGVWHVLGVGVEFGPIVLVAAGVAILFTAVFGNKHGHGV